MKVLIKICGITTPQDARMCVEAGADRLGVIFAPSSRQVSVEQASIISSSVPDTPVVGVFSGCDPDSVIKAVQSARLSLAQLHDCLDPEAWKKITDSCRRPVIPALTVSQASQVSDEIGRSTILLDLAKDPVQRTSAYRASLHRTASMLADLGHPVFIAGGLDPENVAAAVRDTRCLGVDVCGGVESAPGQKDPQLVRQFIAAVRDLETTREGKNAS